LRKSWPGRDTAVAVVLLHGTVVAAEITVMCPPPMRTVLAELIPQFEAATRHRVVVTYQPSKRSSAGSGMAKRPKYAVLTDYAVDDLIKAGRLARRVELARSRIGTRYARRAKAGRQLGSKRSKAHPAGGEVLRPYRHRGQGIFMAALSSRPGRAQEMKPSTLVPTG